MIYSKHPHDVVHAHLSFQNSPLLLSYHYASVQRLACSSSLQTSRRPELFNLPQTLLHSPFASSLCLTCISFSLGGLTHLPTPAQKKYSDPHFHWTLRWSFLQALHTLRYLCDYTCLSVSPTKLWAPLWWGTWPVWVIICTPGQRSLSDVVWMVCR